MKNKILLSSVTLLSALMVAACGNGEKKATEATAEPTTEVTTAAPTTTAPTTTAGASSGAKEVSFADTQRIGNEQFGYINIPKDWVILTIKNSKALNYSSPDKYNVLIMNAYTKDSIELGENETFGAELLANRLYSFLGKDKNKTSIEGVKAIFANEDAYLIKLTFTDGKISYEWVFQKGEKVYDVALEGTADTINTLRPFFEQSFGLDPKTPGK